MTHTNKTNQTNQTKKTNGSKLRVNKESLRTLSPGDLGAAAGGFSGIRNCVIAVIPKPLDHLTWPVGGVVLPGVVAGR